jgi:hypothetical protein
LTIHQGKLILESLKKQTVTAQVKQHCASIQSCPGCKKAFRTKGYYQSTLRSVCGNVGMRIRRLHPCHCSEAQARTFSSLFTNKNLLTPELRYLSAKMAALLPFGKDAGDCGSSKLISTKMTKG